VYPDDKLTLTHSVVESRAMRSRPEVGIVRSRWEMVNQKGEKVLEMEGYGMFGRRAPATAEELARIEAERGAA
jgi:acyl dehydratase